MAKAYWVYLYLEVTKIIVPMGVLRRILMATTPSTVCQRELIRYPLALTLIMHKMVQIWPINEQQSL